MRAGLIAILVAGLGARAAALPLLSLRPGGTVFEGPTDFEPTSIWWNPAAIGALRRPRVLVAGQLLVPRGSWHRDPIDAATGVPGAGADRTFPSQSLDDTDLRYFSAFTWDFGLDNFTFGIAVYAPWDNARAWKEPDAFSSLTLPSGYHVVSESFRHIYLSFAGALKLHPRAYFGISLSTIDSTADLTFYRDAALDGGSPGVAASGYENPASAQRIQVHGDGGSFWRGVLPKPSGLAIGLGMLGQPADRLWLGVSWMHIVPLPSNGSDYNRAYESPDALGAQVTAAGGKLVCTDRDGNLAPCHGGASITYGMPDVYHLGARILLRERLDLTAWVRLVTYGSYDPYGDPAVRGLVVRLSGDPVTKAGAPDRIVLARGLRPSVAVEALGLRWRPIDRLRLALSLVYQSPAVAGDHASPEAIDGHKVDATVGGELRQPVWRGSALKLTAAAGLTVQVPTQASPGAFDPRRRVACVDAASSLEACGDDLAGRALPSATGRLSLVVPHFTLALGLDF
ncbi:MAG: hypothetical protein EXR72_26930 [Myxococcales bacterium]|nr:hypothetical protein [Myxococcales bacterium]